MQGSARKVVALRMARVDLVDTCENGLCVALQVEQVGTAPNFHGDGESLEKEWGVSVSLVCIGTS